MAEKPTITFDCELDDRAIWEISQKGFFEHAVVHLPRGAGAVRLSFWDPVRLAQELEINNKKLGLVCVGEPGLILIPEVTPANMVAAVEELYRTGYFERLRSLYRPEPQVH